MNIIYRNILLILICVVLFSCGIPMSLNPLSDPGDATSDELLYGTWYAEEEDVFIHIGRGDGNIGRVVSVEQNMEDEIEVFDVSMFVTVLGSGKFMNIAVPGKFREACGEKECYIFFRYEIEGQDTLTLHTLDLDRVKEAVKKKELKGRVSGDYEGMVLITDRPKNIVKFIEKDKTGGLFTPLPVFKRFRRPDDQKTEGE